MPAPEAILDLPQRIVTALGIEPEWILQEPDGIGFVAGEVGVWLALRDTVGWQSVLRIEARLARHVPDGPDTWEFCNYLNNLPQFGSLGGRWVHDPATGILALVADLPSVNQAGVAAGFVELYAEFVALLACRAEIAAYNSIPQRELGAGKALTLIAGRRRTAAHPILDRLTGTRHAGGDPAPVHAVEHLVRQRLPELLPAWTGGRWYSAAEDRLELWSGQGVVLSLGVMNNPRLGWGIMIGAGLVVESVRRQMIADGVTPDFPELTADPHTWATLNREASARGSVAPGCWTQGGPDNTVHRLFLPAAILATTAQDSSAMFVSQLAWLAVTQVHSTYDQEFTTAPVLEHPAWPSDEQADVLARREPYNDGARPGNPHAVCHFEDALGRVCGTNADSLALWESRLTEEDRATPGVLDFPRLTSGYIVGGASHRRRT
ncbi:hypothetical protein [Sphaerisporangium perillae]|uniref:hypothetical protein n=1 Tax=Sphaerisporangium perillae TaxID=2935860 RepID=UPI00200F7A61|nr:hypothetical protein [Sphaerisporangium perillae]